tara:strand:- start:207 stop:407 length:201 start_codon:yes stop_codon:yes gene_type:complete
MTLISIDSALKLLSLFRTQRLTKEERERVGDTISQLRRAQVDPDYMRQLNAKPPPKILRKADRLRG